jgi:hypothetical protein
MLNIIVLYYYFVQFTFSIENIHANEKSQAQTYQGYFKSPHTVYQQQNDMNSPVKPKWYLTSNQQSLNNAWHWTNNNDRPSGNFFQNSFPSNQANQVLDWSCGRSSATSRFARIMGGHDAIPHSYPWMVSLAKRSMNNLHLCGGVLVTRRHVLTAAHCIEDFDGAKDLNVLAGIHHINEKNHPFNAMAITVHPQYDPDTFANDIAIVTLAVPLPNNDQRIGTICLPPDDRRGTIYPPVKSGSVAIGWGSTYFGGNPSTTLKQVLLPILETTTWPCNIYVTYAPGQLCAGQLSGGADTCQADSGLSMAMFIDVMCSFLSI